MNARRVSRLWSQAGCVQANAALQRSAGPADRGEPTITTLVAACAWAPACPARSKGIAIVGMSKAVKSDPGSSQDRAGGCWQPATFTHSDPGMTTGTSGEAQPAHHDSRAGQGEYGEAQVGVPTVQTPREPGGLEPARPGRAGRVRMDSPVIRHLAVLASYLTVGIAVTWPRATYLVEGKLPATRDAGVYVWDFWWMLRQVEHLGNPWFTRSIAAPVGSQLGYHALMPLEGVLMLPVTLAFGPSASYNLLSILMPGLLCYATYRAASLWLRSQAGAIAAGAFFGLASDMAWHDWYQMNLAAGALF